MSKSAYPLKLPTSVKTATAQAFLERRAGKATPRDLLTFTRKAGRHTPCEADRR